MDRQENKKDPIYATDRIKVTLLIGINCEPVILTGKQYDDWDDFIYELRKVRYLVSNGITYFLDDGCKVVSAQKI